MSKHSIEVIVVATTAHHLNIQPIAQQHNCPRCEAGQGCGSIAWFQGLKHRQPSTLTVAQTTPPLHIGAHARLSLDSTILNRLSFYTYAAPLLSFIIGLYLAGTVLHHELAQLGIALVCMIMGYLIARRHSNHLLQRALQLMPSDAICQPTRYK